MKRSIITLSFVVVFLSFSLCSCGFYSYVDDYDSINVKCWECSNVLNFNYDDHEDGVVYYYCDDSAKSLPVYNGCPICAYEAGWNELYWEIDDRDGDGFLINPEQMLATLYDYLEDDDLAYYIYEKICEEAYVQFDDLQER